MAERNEPSTAVISVKHPFGTLKYWMGATHFLTKTLPRVSTEMSLHVLAYNLGQKRTSASQHAPPPTPVTRKTNGPS
jgi:hypothetical protein